MDVSIESMAYSVMNLSGGPLTVEGRLADYHFRTNFSSIATGREIFEDPKVVARRIEQHYGENPELLDSIRTGLQAGMPLIAVLHPSIGNFDFPRFCARTIVKCAEPEMLDEFGLLLLSPMNAGLQAKDVVHKAGSVSLLNLSTQPVGLVGPPVRQIQARLKHSFESEPEFDALHAFTESALPYSGDSGLAAYKAVAARDGMVLVQAGRGMPSLHHHFESWDDENPVSDAVAGWMENMLGDTPKLLYIQRQLRSV